MAGNHFPSPFVEGNVTVRTRRPLVLTVLALSATLLMGACGASAEGRSRRLTRPTGADEVVVQVLVAGGFLPPDAVFATVPSVTVLGGGTVITPAPTIEIYPGPAITPLQAADASTKDVDALVRKAADLGLLDGPLEFGRPPVADAPDTIVTVNAGGRTHRHVAYALGIGDSGEERATTGITEREVANRRALQAFVAATSDLPPGEREWRPSTVAVAVLGEHQPDPELPQPEVAWPLPQEPNTAGEGVYPCSLVTGPDAEVLLQTLARANARTPWLVGGRKLSLAFRPQVPGQAGCDGR